MEIFFMWFFQIILEHTILSSVAPVHMYCIVISVVICQKSFPLLGDLKYMPCHYDDKHLSFCLFEDCLKLENVKENNKEEIASILWLCLPPGVLGLQYPVFFFLHNDIFADERSMKPKMLK